MNVVTPLRLVEPLGLYFRAGRNDHTALAHVLAAGPPQFTGVVLDASHANRQKDLIVELAQRHVMTVLDPMAMELATAGGWERQRLRTLPWAGNAIHEPPMFGDSDVVAALVDPIARFAVAGKYGAVLAPSHFVTGVDDPWWRIDQATCRRLRSQLDGLGGADIPIYYRLALARRTLVDPIQRRSIATQLGREDIDAVWLCLHPVGADASASILVSYVDLCRDLASMPVPLVAERTGFLGLTLLGFNAVAGVESGITMGDHFDVTRLARPRDARSLGTPFSPSPRVYIDRLGLFLKRKEAERFFAAKGMRRQFGCQDRPCCRTPDDTIRDPRRHLLHARAQQVAQISHVPPPVRAQVHLDTIRLASDDAMHAARIDKRFEKDQRRLGDWRHALAGLVERGDCTVPAVTLARGRFRRRKSA
jgi:hypothetical protein